MTLADLFAVIRDARLEGRDTASLLAQAGAAAPCVDVCTARWGDEGQLALPLPRGWISWDPASLSVSSGEGIVIRNAIWTADDNVAGRYDLRIEWSEQ